jgi:hypothetical protein
MRRIIHGDFHDGVFHTDIRNKFQDGRRDRQMRLVNRIMKNKLHVEDHKTDVKDAIESKIRSGSLSYYSIK